MMSGRQPRGKGNENIDHSDRTCTTQIYCVKRVSTGEEEDEYGLEESEVLNIQDWNKQSF